MSETPQREQEIKAAIQSKNLNAPRLSPNFIDNIISDSEISYIRIENSTCIVCAIRLPNGFVCTGESAAVSTANFDEDIGKRVAFENARKDIWIHEGYLLRELLFRNEPLGDFYDMIEQTEPGVEPYFQILNKRVRPANSDAESS